MRYSEWGWQKPSTKPILMTKLRNAVKAKAKQEYAFDLKNTAINGNKIGCSGYIKNGDVVVYVMCDETTLRDNRYLVRYDYNGKSIQNRFAKGLDELVAKIVSMLEHPNHNFYGRA